MTSSGGKLVESDLNLGDQFRSPLEEAGFNKFHLFISAS